MIDFTRTFCALHPAELISNFCKMQECNIGLCATCICSHTEIHMQKRTVPEYENIRTTYGKLQETIRGSITLYEQQKSRINALIEVIKTKRKNITDIIFKARYETIDFINQFYDSQQKQILRKVEADEKRLGLHSENRMESLLNTISRDINTLYSSAQDINSQNFLESISRIKMQVLVNSFRTQSQITEELQKNESYNTILKINPLYIAEVRNALEKSISIAITEKIIQPKCIERRNSKHSRYLSSDGEDMNMKLQSKRSAQFNAKSSLISQPKYSQIFTEQFPSQYISQNPTPTMQMKESCFQNNSLQASFQPQTNYGSRGEIRVNSCGKVKQNKPNQTVFTQNYYQNSFGQPISLLDSRKIRRSGLTILKPAQNQIRLQ